MRESELLAHIFAMSKGAGGPGVLVGPGDDCAFVRTGSGGELLLKVDQLIESRHFVPGTSVDLVARKAVARAVSDIAAMAGRPLWSMASAILPPGYAHGQELAERLHRWAREFGCPMVGGDVATGPEGCVLSLSVTVVGEPATPRGAVLRSGARAGDEVWVTGKIGGSFTSGRHLTFTPRVDEASRLARALGDDLHAMIDVSDGLGRDAGRIAERSGVRVVLSGELVPLHDGVSDVVRGASEGEDYELLFVVAPGSFSGDDAAGCTRIGLVEPGCGCVMVIGGRVVEASEMGWDH